MARKRKTPAPPKHDLPVFERIREAATAAASIERRAEGQPGLRTKARETVRAAKAILDEDLTPIRKDLDRYGINSSAFIWCAFHAYVPDDVLKLLIDQRDAARRVRERIRELAAELADLERKGSELHMRGVSEEHAKALEAWANSVNVPPMSNNDTRAIKGGKPGKAAYLRAFMMRLTEERCMPRGVLAVHYEEGRLVPNPYDAVIARMASVVLGKVVTITEVQSARREFRFTISVRTEPPSTLQDDCQ